MKKINKFDELYEHIKKMAHKTYRYGNQYFKGIHIEPMNMIVINAYMENPDSYLSFDNSIFHKSIELKLIDGDFSKKEFKIECSGDVIRFNAKTIYADDNRIVFKGIHSEIYIEIL